MSKTRRGWYWGRGDRVSHFYVASPHYNEMAWAACGTRAIHGFPKQPYAARAKADDPRCRHCNRSSETE